MVNQANKTFARGNQATSLFLDKDYKESLTCLTKFYSTVSEVRRKTGDVVTPQPFLRMVQLAVNKILKIETDQSIIDTLKETFSQLRKKTPKASNSRRISMTYLLSNAKRRSLQMRRWG